MALIKQIELNSGLTANYIRVATISFQQTTSVNVASLRIEIYKDKESRLAKKTPAEVRNLTIDPGVSIPVGDARSSMYDFLKTLPDYSGAEDDLAPL